MLKPNGAAELTAFTEKSYKETITPIVPGIWHVLGVGHSNAVIIEGRTSVILVDTLDTVSYTHLDVYKRQEDIFVLRETAVKEADDRRSAPLVQVNLMACRWSPPSVSLAAVFSTAREQPPL